MTTSQQACGRLFDIEDLQTITRIIQTARPHNRAEIARRVCEQLNWRNIRGELKTMSCRVALLRLHRSGTIQLPPPRNGNGNGQPLSRQIWKPPSEQPLKCSVNDLYQPKLVLVQTKEHSALWNGLIDRYHYLGYRPLPGAQLRYLIVSGESILGAIGWGAAAWKVAERDRWIGWNADQRQARLNQVINNARFLILPWVCCKNLASKVLSMSERRLVDDFYTRYGIRPVLLETFVEQDRFRGTCYRAANWQYLGQTQGRGKCDVTHQAKLPIKAIFVRPLIKSFRQSLGVT
jgi:hypothetical protein